VSNKTCNGFIDHIFEPNHERDINEFIIIMRDFSNFLKSRKKFFKFIKIQYHREKPSYEDLKRRSGESLLGYRERVHGDFLDRRKSYNL
jgi:hypothetical protein